MLVKPVQTGITGLITNFLGMHYSQLNFINPHVQKKGKKQTQTNLNASLQVQAL